MPIYRHRMAATNPRGTPLPSLYDRWLIVSALALIVLGLLMVASSSIAISYQDYNTPFHFLFRQGAYLMLGLVFAMFVARIPTAVWFRASSLLMVFSLACLALVLVPGIGHQINGSTRWLGFAGIGFQISEVVKLFVIIYLAGYLVRHQEEVETQISGFIKPLVILLFVAGLLLKEPDFGATVVIMTTALGMMFLAGVPTSQFLGLLGIVVAAMAFIAVSSPYRLLRLTSFLNPWEHAFQSGYQLTQSLIAFGRGGWFGLGLGESVQKLFYLPEAHTDFIFAVLAEELGLVGMLATLALFAIVVFRALLIGFRARQAGNDFAGYIAFGIGLWIGCQVLINVGVSTGALPTKGLTLPFISFGGSSLLVMCVTLMLLLRIDHETRKMRYGFSPQKRRR